MSLNEGNQWNVSDGDISSWNCGALDESQAFTAGPAHPLSPRVTRHNKRTLKQEAIKSLICLHTRKHSVGFRQQGEEGNRGCRW